VNHTLASTKDVFERVEGGRGRYRVIHPERYVTLPGQATAKEQAS
jgi:hypothetical protein